MVPYCPISKSQSHCIGLLSFSEYDVMRQIKRLDIFKGAGPDGIPPVFIKRCGTVLALPLTIIYNQSLNTGVFPTEWKKARIVPVYKKGDNSDVKNYRPISILSWAAKLFERMVYPLLMNHTKPFLTDSQHGFITKRSVNTNLVTFVSDLCQEIDNGSQIDAIYTDFSSAFDRVNHCLLLRKLESFGVYGPFLEWFRSYLDKRTQTVVVRGYESLNYYADSGVPQGSHLGPLLFLLFINDITSSIRHCKFALFADDLKIYKKIESRNDMELIQSDLNSISTWCNNNSMVLNAGKCFHIKYTRKREPILTSYHIDGTVLQEVDQIRDLGVLIDSKLCFTAHIDKIVSKASQMLGFLKRSCKSFRFSRTRILLYNALVRSHLEFACTVWSPLYAVHSQRIECIQRAFTRHIAYISQGISHRAPYEDRLSFFKMNSLRNRRVVLDLKFLFKILNGFVDCPGIREQLSITVPRQCPRYPITKTFCPRFSRTNLGQFSPINRLMTEYNNLNNRLGDVDIFHMSLAKFSQLLADFFNNVIIIIN